MRIGCDLLRMQYFGYLAKFNFAYEAYRPKVGKSLKKLKGQSQQQKVRLGVCTENVSFHRHFID